MKVLDRHSDYIQFLGDNENDDIGESSLEVRYDNRGEPYREGITLSLRTSEQNSCHVFLERWEVKRLKELLGRLFP